MSADFISEIRATSAIWKLFSILLKMGKYLSPVIFFISIQNTFCCIYIFYFHVHVFLCGSRVGGGTWRLEDNVRSHLHHSSTSLIKQGPSIKPRACWCDWPHQPAYFGIGSLPSKTGLTGRLPAHLSFRWVLRFNLQSLCLHNKRFNREPSPQTLLAYAFFRSELFFQSCFMIGMFHQSVGFSDPLHFILEQGLRPKCSPS